MNTEFADLIRRVKNICKDEGRHEEADAIVKLYAHYLVGQNLFRQIGQMGTDGIIRAINRGEYMEASRRARMLQSAIDNYCSDELT